MGACDLFSAGASLAEYAAFIGTAVFSYLFWASGYMGALVAASRARGWGFRRPKEPEAYRLELL